MTVILLQDQSFIQLVSNLVDNAKKHEQYMLNRRDTNPKTKELVTEIRKQSESVLKNACQVFTEVQILLRNKEAMEMRLGDSERDVIDLRIEVKHLNETIDKLQQQLHESENEIINLKKQLHDSGSEIDNLRKELRDSRSEIINFKKQLYKSEDMIDDLKQQLQSSATEIRNLKKQVQVLTADNERLKKSQEHMTNSAILRQIAINIEFEMKYALLPIVHKEHLTERKILKMDLQTLKDDAFRHNEADALHALRFWLKNSAEEDDFLEAVSYMKDFSKRYAHPTCIDDIPISVSDAKRILNEQDISVETRLPRKKSWESLRPLMIQMVDKLDLIRKKNGQKRLLYS